MYASYLVLPLPANSRGMPEVLLSFMSLGIEHVLVAAVLALEQFQRS